MGILSRAGDALYTYRFLRILTKPWTEMEAYKLGIIDENGKVIKKNRETAEEKSAFTTFHRLAFNLKRLLNKLPFGRSKLASYAAALFLLKEEMDMSEEEMMALMDKVGDFDLEINESKDWKQLDDFSLAPGVYTLNKDVASPITGDMIAPAGTMVQSKGVNEQVDFFLGESIYAVEHVATKQKVYVTVKDIDR